VVLVVPLGDRRDIPVNAHVHAQPKRIAVQVHNPRPVCCRVQCRHPSPALLESRQKLNHTALGHPPPPARWRSVSALHTTSHCISSRSENHQLHGMSANGPAARMVLAMMYTNPPHESPFPPLPSPPLPSNLDPPRKLPVSNRRGPSSNDRST
jgi:hypothetical protein